MYRRCNGVPTVCCALALLAGALTDGGLEATAFAVRSVEGSGDPTVLWKLDTGG